MSDPMRIRSIKPEFFSDPVVAAWSPLARILYVGIWCMSDDCGRFRADPDNIKCELAKKDRAAEFEKAYGEITASGKVMLYEVNGEKYGVVVNWWHQQVEEKKFKSALYPCPTDEILCNIVERAAHNKRCRDDVWPRLRRIIYDASANVRRTFDEHSTPRARPRQGTGNREQGAGSIGDAPTGLEPAGSAQTPTLQQVLDHAVVIGLAPASAQKFWEHFESSSWMRGTTKITHWQSALAKWRTEDQERQAILKKNGGAPAAKIETPQVTNASQC